MLAEQIREQLAQLPESLQQEVLDFIAFLNHKHQKPRPKPVFGSAKGKFRLAEDFDAPLEDFKEYMS